MAADAGDLPAVQVSIHADGEEPIKFAVAKGEVPAGPEAIDTSEFAHGYTGKHDHGDMPAQETNAYTAALRSLQVRPMGCSAMSMGKSRPPITAR